jgi:hypothetical protein
VTGHIAGSDAVRVRDRLVPGAPSRETRLLLTSVGLRIPAELSYEEWERVGRDLAGVVDWSAWCLGDWLVFGKRHYTDRYLRAIRTAGLKYQTLRNYAWVSRRFTLDRRRPRLSFQHHAEVASLPVGKQDWWLDRAERGMWTTKQLRNHIRDEQVESGQKGVDATVVSHIQAPRSQLVRWRRAADHAGIDFNSWVRATLDHAAEATLDHETQLNGPV